VLWGLWRKGIINMHKIKYYRNKYLAVPVFAGSRCRCSTRTASARPGGTVAAVAVSRVQRALRQLPRGQAPASPHTTSMLGWPGSAPAGKQHEAGDGKQRLRRNTHFNSSQMGAVNTAWGCVLILKLLPLKSKVFKHP